MLSNFNHPLPQVVLTFVEAVANALFATQKDAFWEHKNCVRRTAFLTPTSEFNEKAEFNNTAPENDKISD